MTLTESEVTVIGDATMLRLSETDADQWFAVDDDHLAEAFDLSDRGILDRRWHNSDPVFRLSDAAMRGYQLSGFATPN